MSLYQTTVKQGSIDGLDRGAYALYLGIPYGKIPHERSRFAQPQGADAWSLFIQKGYPMDEKEWSAYKEDTPTIYQWT